MTSWLWLSLALAGDPDCSVWTERVAAALAAPCPTADLVALHGRRGEAGGEACLAPALRSFGLGLPRALPVPPPAEEKLVRESFGVPNHVESENFAVWWGNSGGYDANDGDAVADSFEEAWAIELDQLDYPAPATADTYKFNVYLGGTGNNTPSAQGVAGYFWYDDDGYPMVVMNPDSAFGSYGDAASAHEFFHAVQAGIDTLPYEGQGAWWWEATAVWIEAEVHPSNPGRADFAAGVLMRPDLPVNFFDYYDTGAFPEYHQYGAFLFVRWLSEFGPGRELVRETWLEGDEDPLLVIDDALAAEGGVRAALFDYAARNAAFAWEDGDLYEDNVGAWGGWSASYSTRPTGSLSGMTDGWVESGNDAPYTLGTNVWDFDDVPDAFDLAFEGDLAEAWSVEVVWLDDGGQFHRSAAEMSGSNGALHVDNGDEMDETWLVVTVDDGFVDEGVRYEYQFSISPPPEDTGDDDDSGDDGDTDGDGEVPEGTVCGCAGGGEAAGASAALLGLAAVVRRRRRADATASRLQ